MTTAQVVETSVTVNTKVLFRTTFTWTIRLNLLIKKCLLSTLMGVRIKQVGFRENVRAFPREKENCP